jgi:hypothetical protein
MASKKHAQAQASVVEVETIVVGAGTSGIVAARKLQKKIPAMQILVLEADERICSRLQNGFHLIEANHAAKFDLRLESARLSPLLVRWERSWCPVESVDWNSKEWWVSLPPQWKNFFNTEYYLTAGLQDSDTEVAVKTRCPVRAIKEFPSETNDASKWLLESTEQNYLANHVIWAAGLTAFQNAYGKKASQKFLTGNPHYSKEAADYRGALSMEIKFSKAPTLVDGQNNETLLAIPVRFNTKLYLLFAAFTTPKSSPPSDAATGAASSGATVLKTAAHLPQEILNDPKELLSFQKAVRRTLKNILAEGEELPPEHQTRWVIEDRGPAHLLGSAWVLGEGIENSLEFVGEECIAAARSSHKELLAALDSANSLTESKKKTFTPESFAATEVQVS